MRRLLLPATAAVLFGAATFAGVAWGGIAGFGAPLASRILYVHVPTAWAAYAAFLVATVASVLVLLRAPRGGGSRGDGVLAHDALAHACVEVGALFGALALATGVVWARAEFGGDYSLVRDPKLLATLVLVLAYAGNLLLRRSVDEPERRARLGAVYAVLAFVAVPLSYLANRAATPHPDLTGGTDLDGPVWALLGAGALAATALAAALVVLRRDVALAQAAVETAAEGSAW